MNPFMKTRVALLACMVAAAALLGACQQRSAEETGSAGGSTTGSTTGSSGESSGGSTAGTAESARGGMADTAKGASSDTAMTAKVKAALLRDSRINSTDISVETSKGEVVLSGLVDSQSQVDQALQVARNVEGVQKVTNKTKPRH